jgi:hypothetical protein
MMLAEHPEPREIAAALLSANAPPHARPAP